MGTVGLSFGSPTSGAGFDVSSTVALIVGNLQNVETPWKTQLTSLESQDTAISSLGTLFSNLSNDMSSLTNLEGILAEKTGSSSDTNVLSLTAATSGAIAGTHTVTVTNLAQTSSGYLTPIASATTPLTGSITLQAANGTALAITLNSSDNTLAGLASTINASGVGITANVITDSSGARLSLVSGTSGAAGSISVTANSIATALSYTGTAATSTANASGAVGAIAKATDILSGSISIQVGPGSVENVVIGAAPSSPAANTIYTGSGVNTLAGLQGAIAAANLGVTASVVTNSDNTQSLSLVSNTAGSAGALTVTSNLADATTSSLAFKSTTVGKDANLTVDGIPLTSPSNSVANYIPGVTFQLLSPSATESDSSLEQVQVVIGNDNTDVESTMNTFVSDYNALISAVNTQDGNTTSGTPEPLFGSPTLSLLQQQLLSGLNMGNPNGSLDSITDNTDPTLAGSMSILVGSGTTYNVVVGAAPTGSASGYLAAVFNSADTLSGNITLQVGSGTPQNISVPAGAGTNNLDGLAGAINSSGVGITASVVHDSSGSRLSLVSNTTGNITVANDNIVDTTAWLSYTGTAGTGSGSGAVASTGTLTGIANAGDSLYGSIAIQVGNGAPQVVVVPSGTGMNTLDGLAGAINDTPNIGVTASVVTSNGVSSLSLLSNTPGDLGTLTVESAVADASQTGSTSLGYTVSPPANTIYTGTASGYNTLSGIVAAINSANIGVTASVATSTGTSTLSLMSQTEGATGALTVTSKIAATSDTLLTYSGTAGADVTNTTNAVTASGTLNSVPNSSDILSGSFSIQVGSGTAQTFTMNSSDNTLSGLKAAINAANMGVSAQVVTNPNGSSALQLTSETAGSAGTFNVTSSILDTTNTSTKTLNYTNSSDITSLTTLGIAVNNDGSITLDAASLDSLLNSDYSSIVGFFQNASGWGQSFSNILTNAGTSSATGILSLASGSNSNIESTLNADISKEEALISAQQKSLTAELNSANEIMQELPSQLDGVNELYSAITGYNQNSNG